MVSNFVMKVDHTLIVTKTTQNLVHIGWIPNVTAVQSLNIRHYTPVSDLVKSCVVRLFELFRSLRWNWRNRSNTFPAQPIPKSCHIPFTVPPFHLFLFLTIVKRNAVLGLPSTSIFCVIIYWYLRQAIITARKRVFPNDEKLWKCSDHVFTLTQVGTRVYLGQTHLGTPFQVPAWIRKFSLGSTENQVFSLIIIQSLFVQEK